MEKIIETIRKHDKYSNPTEIEENARILLQDLQQIPYIKSAFSSVTNDESNEMSFLQIFKYIRFQLSKVPKQYHQEFFRIMEENGYNMKMDLIDILLSLCYKKTSIYKPMPKSAFKTSPLYYERHTNRADYDVLNTVYGTINYKKASSVFPDMIECCELFHDENHCHDAAFTLQDLSPEATVKSALMPGYFTDKINHSYLVMPQGTVVDYRYNLHMPEQDYNTLFEPEVYLTVHGKER